MRRFAFVLSLGAVASCEVVAGLGDVPDALAPGVDAGGDRGTGNETSTDSGADVMVAGDSGAPTIGPCRIFPPDNPWNRDISGDPVDTNAMSQVFPNMATTSPIHPDWGDFGSGGTGIPFNVSQATPVPVTVGDTQNSDSLPCTGGGGAYCYPIPAGAVTSPQATIVLDTTGAPDNCTLFEVSTATKDTSGPGWSGNLGAFWHLGSNALRSDGKRSCDQAGLPILPGLVRFDELSKGSIQHAIRLTMRNTFLGYIHPATYSSGVSTAGLPPMGLRLRLKSGFTFPGTPTSPFTPTLLTALQHYGVILADKGSDWYMTGEQNAGFGTAVMDPLVSDLRSVHGSDFEIVQSGPVLTTGL